MTWRLASALVGGAFALGVLFGATAGAGISDVAAAPVVEAALNGTEQEGTCPMSSGMMDGTSGMMGGTGGMSGMGGTGGMMGEGVERCPMADHACPMDAAGMAAMEQMHAGMEQMHAGMEHLHVGMTHEEGRSPDDRERGRGGMTHGEGMTQGEGMTSGEHESHHSPEAEADR
jgi:hypothetical protein